MPTAVPSRLCPYQMSGLTVNDIDDGEARFVEVAEGTEGDKGFGTFSLSEDGNWTYTIDNSKSEVQSLGLGEELQDSLTVTSADGSASVTLTVTINRVERCPRDRRFRRRDRGRKR